MEYGYCNVTLIPCRAEPSDKAEQVNQLLFGECYKVLEKKEKWALIQTVLDNYSGWIDARLHTPLSPGFIQSIDPTAAFVVNKPLFRVFSETQQEYIFLTCGAVIPVLKGRMFSIGEHSYKIEDEIEQRSDLKLLMDFSRQFLNAPYLWGGKTLFGIDCSGFVQVVFRVFGIWLPRDAYQQAEVGTTVSNPGDIRPGDLAFFGEPGGKITHVGICAGNGKIIHASGRCRIDHLDEKGIKNYATGNYSHPLRNIQRVIQ